MQSSLPALRTNKRRRRPTRQTAYMEFLEQRMLMTGFGLSSLSGSWSFTGRQTDGILSFNGSGAILGTSITDNNATTTVAGTSYVVNADGTVELHLTDNASTSIYDGIGAISSTGDVVVTNFQTLPGSDDSAGLAILLRRTDAYSNTDVAGTWNFNTSGARGSFTADAAGHFSGSVLAINDSGSATVAATILSTSSYTIDSGTGAVTLTVNLSNSEVLTFDGFLDFNKDVMALHGPADPSAGPEEDRSFVAVKRSGTYSNADLLGKFTLAGQTVRGTVFADGAGHLLSGQVSDSGGDSVAVTGSYTVSAAGLFTLTIVASSAEGNQSLNFSGGLNASKNVVIAGRTSLSGAQLTDGDTFDTILLVQSEQQSVLQLLPTDGIAAESGTPASNKASFTLTRFGSTTSALTVALDITGTATQDTDYVLSAGGVTLTNSVTIPAGASSVVLLLTPTDDADGETTEVATLTLGTGSTYTLATSSASAVIFDNDLTTFANADLFGGWSLVTGRNSGSITFDGAGNITGGNAVDNLQSDDIEGDTYTVNADGSLQLHITDNSTNPLYDGIGVISSTRDLIATNALTLPQTNGDDNAGLAVFLQHLGAFTNADVAGTWNFAKFGGRGSFVADATGHITSGTILKINGTQNATVTRSILNTSTYSVDPQTGELHFTINTSSGSSETFDGFMNTSRDVMSLAETPDSFAGDDTDRTVLLVRSRGTYTNADFLGTYALAGGNGVGTIQADGLGHITSGLVTGSDGATNSITGTYSVLANGGVTYKLTVVGADGTETLNFTGNLNAGKNALLSARTALTPTQLTNGDDFDPILLVRSLEQPVVSIVSKGPASEIGLKPATYIVSRFGSTINPLVVHFTVSGSGTLGTDYTLSSGGSTITDTITIPAGSSSAVITLTPITDSFAEATETAIVTLDADPAYEVNSLKTAGSVGILDFSSTLSVAVSKAKASEVNGSTSGLGQFTVIRTGGDLTIPLTVDFTLSGFAVRTINYNVNTSGTLTFNNSTGTGTVTIPAGKSSANIPFTPIDDNVANFITNNVIFTIDPDANPSYAINPLKTNATINIADAAPTISVIASDAAASEINGSTSGMGTFTFIRTGGNLNNPLTVVFGLDGNAIEGTDYDTISPHTITFPAHQSTVKLNVTPIRDGLGEGTEAVVAVVNPDTFQTYNLNLAKSTATVNISDAASVISVAVTKATASEVNGLTSGAGKFTITRTGGDLKVPLTVNFTLSGSATEGTDYATVSPHTVTFAPNKTTAVVTFNPIDDVITEGPAEVVLLNLAPDGGPTYINNPSKSSAFITIKEDLRPLITGPIGIPDATLGVPFAISYNALVGYTNAQARSGDIVFKITKVIKGPLTKGIAADPVIANTTTVASGEFLTWSPLVAGTAPVFNVVAINGTNVSATMTIKIHTV